MTAAALITAGWHRTTNGRWWHPALAPGEANRRRLLTEAEATTLQSASEDLAKTVRGIVLGTAIPDRRDHA